MWASWAGPTELPPSGSFPVVSSDVQCSQALGLGGSHWVKRFVGVTAWNAHDTQRAETRDNYEEATWLQGACVRVGNLCQGCGLECKGY